MRTSKAFFLSSLCALVVAPNLSQAQSIDLPSSVDPARLQERYYSPEPQAPQTIIAPDDIVVDKTIPDAPDGFILQGVNFEGMTVFQVDYFNSLLAEYINRRVDIGVLNHLAMRITKAYHGKGYLLARVIVPQQEITDGRVLIRVIEGRIGNVIIDDENNLLKHDHLSILQDTVLKIESMVPLHGPTLERYILLLNDFAGIQVRSILRAPDEPSQSGTVDVVLKIAEKEGQGQLAYDNHGSRYIGPHQIGATYTNGNLINAFDQLTLQSSTALPMSEAMFGAATYSLPLNAEGLKASVMMSYANSHPGLNLREVEVEGRSTSIEASLSYPYWRTRQDNLYFGSTLSIRQSATEFLGEELIDDKTRSLSLFANYSHLSADDSYSFVKAEVARGLDIMGATETGSDNLSRAQGQSDFIKVSFDAMHQRYFSDVIQLYTSARAQHAPHPLLSSEEFGFGGIDFGRAYNPSEITGDRGVAIAAEFRYTGLGGLPDTNLYLTPFIFYDVGKVWNEDTGSDAVSAASLGFGTHYNFDNKITGALQIAYPLTKAVNTPAVMGGERGPRILFELKSTF